MKCLVQSGKTLLVAAAAIGAVSFVGGAANAAIVCNQWGDCWHVHRHWGYPAPGFVYHPDDWYFHRHWGGPGPYQWRDWHPGRGYWRQGVWVPF